jgi:hypothetical protein
MSCPVAKKACPLRGLGVMVARDKLETCSLWVSKVCLGIVDLKGFFIAGAVAQGA